MKTQAAILWAPHTDWSVEDIELDSPRSGEVLVRLAASGICHSEDHLVTGDMVLDPELARAYGLEQFPIIGGHEGAGEIVSPGGPTPRRPGLAPSPRSSPEGLTGNETPTLGR